MYKKWLETLVKKWLKTIINNHHKL